MRLIDATKLERQINENMMLSNMTDDFYKGAMWVLKQIYKFRREKDALLVKHGHLCSTDAYPHRLYCSECNKTLIPNEDICFEKNDFPKYCMWCGAKLDEEAGNERNI